MRLTLWAGISGWHYRVIALPRPAALEVSLLVSTTHRVELTEAGRMLYESTTAAVEHLRQNRSDGRTGIQLTHKSTQPLSPRHGRRRLFDVPQSEHRPAALRLGKTEGACEHGAKRAATAPDLPTMNETGVTDVARRPTESSRRLARRQLATSSFNQEFVRVLALQT